MKSFVSKSLLLFALLALLNGLLLYMNKLAFWQFQRLSVWIVAAGVSVFGLSYICANEGLINALQRLLAVLYGARKLLAGLTGMLLTWITFMSTERLDSATFAMLFGGIVFAFFGSNVLSKKFSPESLAADKDTTIDVKGDVTEMNVGDQTQPSQ